MIAWGRCGFGHVGRFNVWLQSLQSAGMAYRGCPNTDLLPRPCPHGLARPGGHGPVYPPSPDCLHVSELQPKNPLLSPSRSAKLKQ